MAEAEFTLDAVSEAFLPPAYSVAEVTNGVRFTGGAPQLPTEAEVWRPG